MQLPSSLAPEAVIAAIKARSFSGRTTAIQSYPMPTAGIQAIRKRRKTARQNRKRGQR